jgi:hypothetical protein
MSDSVNPEEVKYKETLEKLKKYWDDNNIPQHMRCNPPMPRPGANPKDYSGYPPGVTPEDLGELFKQIRKEADS